MGFDTWFSEQVTELRPHVPVTFQNSLRPMQVRGPELLSFVSFIENSSLPLTLSSFHYSVYHLIFVYCLSFRTRVQIQGIQEASGFVLFYCIPRT